MVIHENTVLQRFITRAFKAMIKLFEKRVDFFYWKIFRGIHKPKKTLRTSAVLEIKYFILSRCFWNIIDFVWFHLNYLDDNLKIELQKAVVLSVECVINCILKIKILFQEACEVGPGFLENDQTITQKEKQHSLQNAAVTSVFCISVFSFSSLPDLFSVHRH